MDYKKIIQNSFWHTNVNSYDIHGKIARCVITSKGKIVMFLFFPTDVISVTILQCKKKDGYSRIWSIAPFLTCRQCWHSQMLCVSISTPVPRFLSNTPSICFWNMATQRIWNASVVNQIWAINSFGSQGPHSSRTLHSERYLAVSTVADKVNHRNIQHTFAKSIIRRAAFLHLI